MSPRAFLESERAARARAEVDPATRDRITWAHDHVAPIVGSTGAMLRRAGRFLLRPRAVEYQSTLRAAGLTVGEALAAGIVRS